MAKKKIKVILIANPAAGDATTTASRIEQAVKSLSETGLKVHVALAHPKIKAMAIARKAVKDGYKVVIAMGGDGTIGAVIRGISGSRVKLGIIPAGTQNDFAASLGIPEDIKEACAMIAAGKIQKLDLGRLRTKSQKKYDFFMTTAVGLTATIFPYVMDIPEGKLSGIRNSIDTLFHFKSNPKVFLTLDDESKIEVESMLVTITNTPLIGAKNLVAPDASTQDGLLDIAVYPGFSKADLIAYFAKTSQKGSTPDGNIQRYQARKIKIKTSPKLDIAAEGIPMGKGTAWIKILPHTLRVIAPEPGAGAEKPE